MKLPKIIITVSKLNGHYANIDGLLTSTCSTEIELVQNELKGIDLNLYDHSTHGIKGIDFSAVTTWTLTKGEA